jgi:uncharacterized iron-regulated membrane protein
MQNSIPVFIGTVTIFGIAVNHHYVILGTSIVVLITCGVVMWSIIRNCDKRNKRLENINNRRRKNDADTPPSNTR